MVAVCQLTEGHPFYTQHLCHLLWEQCDTGGEVTQDSIKIGVRLVLERESYGLRHAVGLPSIEPASVPKQPRHFAQRSQTILSGVLAALSSRAGINRATGSSRLALT